MECVWGSYLEDLKGVTMGFVESSVVPCGGGLRDGEFL